jgi:two-component system chemotaxis response regulator CheY
MNIIVADDSMVVRSVVTKVVTSLGHEPIQATHGGEVLDILEKMGKDISLILMDWNMPTMDGFQALQTLKNDQRFALIPVIMLTSESDDKKIKMAFDAGVSGYVEKPFTSEELIESLKKVIKV